MCETLSPPEDGKAKVLNVAQFHLGLSYTMCWKIRGLHFNQNRRGSREAVAISPRCTGVLKQRELGLHEIDQCVPQALGDAIKEGNTMESSA